MMASQFSAIALDLGTTSIKAGLMDQHGALGNIVALAAPQITAQDGRYESDALLYAATAERALAACLAHASASLPLGLCSQRSSFLIWEKSTGQPLTPLISWQDNRGAASCEVLRTSENIIHDLTGLRLTPYYFAPKLRVVLQENPQWRNQLERGELLVGTLNTFLIWRWSSGQHHVTDASMAARTLLMDIQQQQWSPTLCQLFDIPLYILPQIKPSSEMNLQLDNGLILQANLGDQSAALIASIEESQAEALVNLGTGGFVIRYLPKKINPPDGYLRTLIYQKKNPGQDITLHTHIAIEGTLNSIAVALAPYPVSECRVEDLGVNNIFCLAEPSGIGAPYFRSDLGLRFSESIDHLVPRHIATLLLEGIIFRVTRILEDFHRTSALERVYLSGGLSELICLQQGLAACIPFDIYRLPQKDSSLQGAALLAAGVSAEYKHPQEKIVLTHHTPALAEKYQHWKAWLDDLLYPAM